MDDDAPSLALALDEIEERPVGEKKYLKGPFLLVRIGEGASLEVLDGPPWEAETNHHCTLAADHVPEAGVWIAEGAFVVCRTETTIHGRFPQPYTIEVRQDRTEPDQPREKIVRMLERAGAEVLHEADLTARRGGFAARLRVPYGSREKVLEYLSLIDVEFEQLDGQPHLERLT